MKIIILLILIGWLITSLPQDAFIWAATRHPQWSFDWLMGYARAGLLGFLPVLTVWIEVILDQRHLAISKEEYKKRERSWNRQEQKRGTDWAAAYPLIDEDDFLTQNITPAKKLARWIPWMFIMLISIISISYLGYYEEFGIDLKMYYIEWWGQPVGGLFLRPFVTIIRTFITGIVSYVLAKLAAIMNVQSLFEKALIEEKPKRIEKLPHREPKKILPQLNVNKRQEAIVELYRNDGDGDFSSLAKELGVSFETLRRDRKQLLETGPLVKLSRGKYFVINHEDETELPIEIGDGIIPDR